jgi:hypothetical protein
MIEGKRRAGVGAGCCSDSESGWVRRIERGERCWGDDTGEDGGERVKLEMRAVAFRLDEAVGVTSRRARGLVCLGAW